MENKSISSDLIRGHIDTIILYSLLNNDKCAQQISDSIEEKSENKYQINQATLYSSLKRLETLKFVSAYWHDSDAGRRRFFKLTQLGKENVESSLNNWSYSRAIIDKLIDTESEPIKTTIIEKPVIKEVYIEKPVEKIIQTPAFNTENTKTSEKIEIKPTLSNSQNIDSQEFNFRNILNGLIKTAEKPKTTPLESVSEEKPDKNAEIERDINSLNVKKFNETIKDETSNEKLISKCNQIDFEDLMIKAQTEGYDLKVSSKNRDVKTGTLFINKVRFLSSLTIFLLCLVEFFIITLTTKQSIKLSGLALGLIITALVLFPVIFAIIYIKNPKRTSDKIKKDTILTAGIIVFNLILFTVVINLLCNVDFTNTLCLVSYLITPLLICFDVFMYVLIRYEIAKSKYVKVKNIK